MGRNSASPWMIPDKIEKESVIYKLPHNTFDGYIYLYIIYIIKNRWKIQGGERNFYIKKNAEQYFCAKQKRDTKYLVLVIDIRFTP